MTAPFPELPADWEATRATLHAYAHAVGAVPRAHAVAHPKWFHVSLKVRPTGLTTDNVSLPEGGILNLAMDLRNHAVVVETSAGDRHEIRMDAGLTGTEMGDRIVALAAGYGLEGPFSSEKFENDDARPYDAAAAETFFRAVTSASQVFQAHRAALEGPVGIVQMWPHGFDLSTEWYGTRVETHEEGGETAEYPSQINLGFYPGGDRPYFYSNPWPFEQALTASDLPYDAEWTTESFEGSVYHYDLLAGDPEAAAKLADYARAVHDLAAPTLLA